MKWLNIPDIECDMDKDAKIGTCSRCSVNIKNATEWGEAKEMSQRGSESPDNARVDCCLDLALLFSDMGNEGFARLWQGQADYYVKEA